MYRTMALEVDRLMELRRTPTFLSAPRAPPARESRPGMIYNQTSTRMTP